MLSSDTIIPKGIAGAIPGQDEWRVNGLRKGVNGGVCEFCDYIISATLNP